VLVSCEHASCEVPSGVSLGVASEAMAGHVGWDRGAAFVARRLAEALSAPLHLGRWSRLFVDLNRSEEAAIPSVAWGIDIPGNRALSDRERRTRLRRWHRPYRAAVEADARAAIRLDGACLHLSVHSFTPDLPGARDHDVGLLFDPARPAEVGLAARLAGVLAEAGFSTRDNAPYLGTDDGLTTTLRTHFPYPTYAGIEIELNQRLDEGTMLRVGAAIARALSDSAPSEPEPPARAPRSRSAPSRLVERAKP
jgi:predicted N-formylglutamate amidohydrolase